jgi:hypothetical protein
MSAGNAFGTLMACVVFSGFWIVGALVIWSNGNAFNRMILSGGVMQDAVNGFYITQWIYVAFGIVFWLAAWINYAINESNEATQNV